MEATEASLQSNKYFTLYPLYNLRKKKIQHMCGSGDLHFFHSYDKLKIHEQHSTALIWIYNSRTGEE